MTFVAGTDPDIAQVQVQNKVQQATSRLPQEVTQQGVIVQKSQFSFQLIVGISDTMGRYNNIDISDYLGEPPARSDLARARRRRRAGVRCRRTRCASGSIRTSSFRTT